MSLGPEHLKEDTETRTSSVPLGKFRVRPSYRHFLQLRDTGQIPKGMTHNRWEEENQELVQRLDAR